MVGNSSSGLIEAPSFGLPVVNVGDRQRGRLRAANVIDVGHDREAIAAAIRRALDPGFRRAWPASSTPTATATRLRGSRGCCERSSWGRGSCASASPTRLPDASPQRGSSSPNAYATLARVSG